MGKTNVKINQGDYKNIDAVENVISYIAKLDNQEYLGGMGIYPVSPKMAIHIFETVQEIYGLHNVRKVWHLCISPCKDRNFNNDDLLEIAYRIADYFFKMTYQVWFGIHDDTEHTHIHIAINPVSYANGERLCEIPLEDFRNYVDEVIETYHVKVISPIYFDGACGA